MWVRVPPWALKRESHSRFFYALTFPTLRGPTPSHDLTLHTTHQDIANDLHTSRVAVSRLLKGFEKEGVLSLHRNAIEMATF